METRKRVRGETPRETDDTLRAAVAAAYTIF